MKLKNIDVVDAFYNYSKNKTNTPLEILRNHSNLSDKEILYAIEKCYNRGYIDCGVSIGLGYLTEKGLKYYEDYDLKWEFYEKIIQHLSFIKRSLNKINEEFKENNFSNKNIRYIKLIDKTLDILINRIIHLQERI